MLNDTTMRRMFSNGKIAVLFSDRGLLAICSECGWNCFYGYHQLDMPHNIQAVTNHNCAKK